MPGTQGKKKGDPKIRIALFTMLSID